MKNSVTLDILVSIEAVHNTSLDYGINTDLLRAFDDQNLLSICKNEINYLMHLVVSLEQPMLVSWGYNPLDFVLFPLLVVTDSGKLPVLSVWVK